MDKPADHDDRQNSDGNVDVEGVSPAIGIGKPAAKRGADDGRNDHSKGEDSHGCSAHAGRKALKQDGLGEWLKRAASGALNDAGNEDEAEGRCSSAEEG